MTAIRVPLDTKEVVSAILSSGSKSAIHAVDPASVDSTVVVTMCGRVAELVPFVAIDASVWPEHEPKITCRNCLRSRQGKRNK